MEPPRDGRPLVISDPMLFVRRANERLVLYREGRLVAAVPLSEISRVAVHGPATFTGAAIAGILDAGLDVLLFTSGGRFRGIVHSARPKNVFLLLAQVAAWNDQERRLHLSRALVVSKIAGQRALLQRHALDHASEPCEHAAAKLRSIEAQAAEETDVDRLRGIEGTASAVYFSAFGDMLKGEWTFEKRTRRPPKDPVNALLSFGYVMAGAEVARHLTLAGFDTRIGLYHGIRYGRDSLPLDLVEELRAPMVDRLVLRMLNRRQFVPEDFHTLDDGAVRLGDDARRRFLDAWERHLIGRAARIPNESPTGDPGARRIGRRTDPDDEPHTSWRRRIERQVARLRRYLLEGKPYRPLQLTRKPKDSAPEAPRSDSQRPTDRPDPPAPLDETDRE